MPSLAKLKCYHKIICHLNKAQSVLISKSCRYRLKEIRLDYNEMRRGV